MNPVATESVKAPKAPKKAATTSGGRKILHATPFSEVTELTSDRAKELLGWLPESTDEGADKFGSEFFVTSADGKVRTTNNTNNRALQISNVLVLKQEILNKRWKLNGEPIIIGKTGLVLNGQHTLTALIMADDDRKSEAHWKSAWRGVVSISKLIVYGIDESDAVVNTLDTAKSRTLADVLFRSHYFAKIPASQRKVVSKIADYAIRFIWHRSGASIDAYAPRRTHAEALDFINRHPKFLEVVKHIYEKEGGADKKISKYLSLGTAAGLCYLMGTCTTDTEAYADARSEKVVDFTHMDDAKEFWAIMAGEPIEYVVVRKALGKLNDSETGVGGTSSEKVAIFMLCWNKLIENGFKEPTPADLKLTYSTQDNVSRLKTKVTVGGIDLGEQKDQLDAMKDGEGDSEYVPTESEIAKEKAKIKAEKSLAKMDETETDEDGFPLDDDDADDA